MLYNELAKSAAKAVETSGTVQGEVRRILADLPQNEAFSTITEAMSELKTWCEDTYIPIMDNGSDDSLKRKQVNNVINDVSRIVRTETGYSIKCTQRTPEYIYAALPFEPRTATVVPEPPSATPVVEPELNLSDKLKAVRSMIQDQPDVVMAIMFQQYEDAGKLSEIFKDAKNIVDIN